MMRRSVYGLWMALVAGTVLLACGEATDEAPVGETSQGLPTGHVPIPGSMDPANAPASQKATPATVLETMDAGGYTYARVQTQGEEAWLAGPQTAIGVGDELMISSALPMEGFTSNALGRTFDLVYFVNSFGTGGPVNSSPNRDAAPEVIGGSQGTASEVLSGGGYTYVHVDVDGESLWLASPTVSVSEGQTVSWQGGSRMDGFTSSTLNRSFEKILFVGGISVVH